MNNSREILAPAGSYDTMKAAFFAGADAVYAGGRQFGARASAVNFSDQELLDAIHYAHIHGKKFYLTVNTLLKDKELDMSFVDYMNPLYEAGLDAVIVQDFGVMEKIHHIYPELAIHASTQMNTTGPFFADFLKKYGVTRVVTARELSLQEIRQIYETTGLEIESFVHGALCYCYSGQCLLSSMIGQRSGNRGRCAQPCRLAYDVLKNGTKINHTENKYALSPKDLCTLWIIPDILEAGVYSLKIEGRMKKPEYVACVTAMYRKYVDMYLKNGREGYRVSEEDIRLLQEIYNRGGFTEGYYKRHNGKELMSMEKPNHCGVAVAKIRSINKNTISLQAVRELESGDVLEFDLASSPNYTLGHSVSAGSSFTIKNKFQNGAFLMEKLLHSSNVFRMRNNSLIQKITDNYMSNDLQTPVEGYALFRKGEAVSLTLHCRGFSVTVYGPVVQQAQNRPLTAEDIRQKLSKTGTSFYTFSHLSIECEDDIFLPIKEINDLRRLAFSALTDEILQTFNRKSFPSSEYPGTKGTSEKPVPADYKVSVLISTEEQFFAVADMEYVQQIYFEAALFSEQQLYRLSGVAKSKGKLVFLALPYIFRQPAEQDSKKHLNLYENDNIDGLIIRNMEEYFYIQSLNFNKSLIFDNTIYCYNKSSKDFIDGFHPRYITFSRELNFAELKDLEVPNGELEIYGYQPVMFTAGCIRKNFDKCDKISSIGTYHLKDRTNSLLKIITVCKYCYNVIYYSKPLLLFGELSDCLELFPLSLRLSFTFESGAETKNILEKFRQTQTGHDISSKEISDYTRGHFRRGVQ